MIRSGRKRRSTPIAGWMLYVRPRTRTLRLEAQASPQPGALLGGQGLRLEHGHEAGGPGVPRAIAAAGQERGRRLPELEPRVRTADAGPRVVAIAGPGHRVEVRASKDEGPCPGAGLDEHEAVDPLLPPEKQPAQGREVPDRPARLDGRGLAAGCATAAVASQQVGALAPPAAPRVVRREVEMEAPSGDALAG